MAQEYNHYFYNNYKWSIAFKTCELLCCTPETYLILYVNYAWGNSLAVQWLGFHTFTAVSRDSVLAKELKSHKSQGIVHDLFH